MKGIRADFTNDPIRGVDIGIGTSIADRIDLVFPRVEPGSDDPEIVVLTDLPVDDYDKFCVTLRSLGAFANHSIDAVHQVLGRQTGGKTKFVFNLGPPGPQH